ncbi:hypothetical protein EVAR_74396_1 [Eumeta japonica]|uniref:Reverse transcriptase domain-containing protein n=1 Tax=Eumeta variegata TaxID=151549 RepID=A0A4C1SG64_EUMVA|nr:hypothetical protein EVAR_74396_1 [Eumeta japonica]
MNELSIKCLLYADDQVILALSAGELQKIVNKMNDSVKKRDTKVNVIKTKRKHENRISTVEVRSLCNTRMYRVSLNGRCRNSKRKRAVWQSSIRATGQQVISATHGNSKAKRSHQDVAGLLGRNITFGERISGLVEGRNDILELSQKSLKNIRRPVPAPIGRALAFGECVAAFRAAFLISFRAAICAAPRRQPTGDQAGVSRIASVSVDALASRSQSYRLVYRAPPMHLLIYFILYVLLLATSGPVRCQDRCATPFWIMSGCKT